MTTRMVLQEFKDSGIRRELFKNTMGMWIITEDKTGHVTKSTFDQRGSFKGTTVIRQGRGRKLAL